MLHDIGELDTKPEVAGVDVVVFGHSHRVKIERSQSGVLFLQSGQRRATAIPPADHPWRAAN